MHTLYLGPSWAVQSFESTQGIDDPVKTNLAQELGLTNYTSLALYASSNLDQFKEAQLFIQQHTELSPFRIVFVIGNSLRDGPLDSGMTEVEWAKTFLVSNDPLDIVMSLEQEFYKKLNSLGIPVALIGAHTDVSCESHDNITVIHPSWQNFLGQQSGLNKFYGWAAEIAHRWLQGVYIPKYGPPANFELSRKPSPAVVSEIYKMIFYIWKPMEEHKLFCGSHPTILGNQLFAKEIAKPFKQWIDNAV
tara:strand:+ start:61 stop:804 length:744 start_codon:yes stop_codon:yes gene_type:complete